jgi:hypothetical protein
MGHRRRPGPQSNELTAMSELILHSNIDVDFLPARYREQSAKRKTNVWRVAVVLSFAGLILAAAGAQYRTRRALENQLAEMAPLGAAAQARSEQLGLLRAQLEQANARASLITYLQHPWPRTQILAAVLGPLPASVKLHELQLQREDRGGNRGASARRFPQPAERSETDSETPTIAEQADLEDLRSDFDQRRTIVSLEGTTENVGELHLYLNEAAHHPLILTAEVLSIERKGEEDVKRAAGFELRLIIAPGFGQSGGPQQPAEVVPSQKAIQATTPNPARAPNKSTRLASREGDAS